MDFNDRRPQPPDLSELQGHVKRARASSTALQRLNTDTTAGLNAAMRHRDTIKGAHEALEAAGRRDVVGALMEEHGISMRLREARAKGQERPELQQRLKTARASLRL